MRNTRLFLTLGLVAASLALIGCSTATSLSPTSQQRAGSADSSYSWLPGKLIPNEFGLPDGTWSNSSIRECMSKCSDNKTCSGFSIEAKFGDAWQAGCQDGMCDAKIECHAKGVRDSNEYWLPTDTEIRNAAVSATSNAWIKDWGTILKK